MGKQGHKRRGYRSNEHAARYTSQPEMTEQEALDRVAELEEPLVLVLDGVQDPHNLGACLRSANAAGVDVVIAPRKGTSGVTETVRHIACGGADHTPYVQVGNLNRFLEKLQKLDLHLVGTGDAASQLIYETELSGPLALVMGSEARGLRTKTAEKCDALVRLPMLGEVDCLNLSVATGVCLYEAIRQRTNA